MSLFVDDNGDSAVEGNSTVISKSVEEKNKLQQKTSQCVTYRKEFPRYRSDLSRDSRPAEFP